MGGLVTGPKIFGMIFFYHHHHHHQQQHLLLNPSALALEFEGDRLHILWQLLEQQEKYQQEAADLIPPPGTSMLSKIIPKIHHQQHQQQHQFRRVNEPKQQPYPFLLLRLMGLNALFEKLWFLQNLHLKKQEV
uniref:Uncharacterized protein n=1 Tax=Pseudo-nitzschia australis TaxID=44445 RepID=A0A7S4ADB6_9STRA